MSGGYLYSAAVGWTSCTTRCRAGRWCVGCAGLGLSCSRSLGGWRWSGRISSLESRKGVVSIHLDIWVLVEGKEGWDGNVER